MQAGDDPLENALKNDPDNTLFKTLLSSLKLKAEEEKTKGTFFMPSDRVRSFPRSFSVCSTPWPVSAAHRCTPEVPAPAYARAAASSSLVSLAAAFTTASHGVPCCLHRCCWLLWSGHPCVPW